ncbi:cell division protein ZapC domain-containing protein [Planctobacterium marinum]|uniref:cell division protein ZapC domain-containing protein n=1 Tax=Planctobacterium marinum TaxID=1631968 RepID=UPI001E3E383E|nr:cell division protein ZapC domain-containing protein [Planctobacterium marinum]MCC2604362.1 cell division protein ZapC [Planctobacterium marinum]
MSFLLPSPHWQWELDPEFKCLTLNLDTGHKVVTGIAAKQLRDKDLSSVAFSVTDTEIYNELVEYIEISVFNQWPELAFQVVINATAALVFHKEIAAKNWLYQENVDANSMSVTIPGLASVTSRFDGADILLLNPEGHYVLAMLLQPYQINETKQLAAFSLIKVGVDRLFAFTGDSLENAGTDEYV